MDMQKMIDSFSSGMRAARSDYHVNLGDLITHLEKADKNKLVKFSTGEFVGGEASYRGYYSDLSFENSDKKKTVGEFLDQCKNALNKTYVGYKGGDFLMDKETPLWRAYYGSCGDAIVTYIDGEDFVLVCKNLDD